MRVLWQVPDGREFVIVGKDMDEIQDKIALKRQELGLPTPQIMVAKTDHPELLKSKAPLLSVNDFNEEDRKAIQKEIEETQAKVNNRKSN